MRYYLLIFLVIVASACGGPEYNWNLQGLERNPTLNSNYDVYDCLGQTYPLLMPIHNDLLAMVPAMKNILGVSRFYLAAGIRDLFESGYKSIIVEVYEDDKVLERVKVTFDIQPTGSSSCMNVYVSGILQDDRYHEQCMSVYKVI